MSDQVHLLNQGGEFRVEHGAYNSLFKFEVDNRLNEYFLIENRSRIGMDLYCPSDGLAVYHCDIMGSNEWQGGLADKHYQCALIQADGARHLENKRNYGDPGDLFQNKSGLALSYDTAPSSRVWGGEDSGLSLFDISEPGDTISFKAGSISEPDSPANSIIKESRLSILILDDDPQGISDSITMTTQAEILKIKVGVNITHTYIGDLKLELISPKGKIITLRDRKGGGTDDLGETYDSGTILSSLVGKQLIGTWTLKVKDKAGQDTGKLRSWKIEVNYRKKSLGFSEQKEVNRPIPDNDFQGIKDSITVTQGGKVKNLAVSIDINHIYHGDLMVRLLTPSGRSATLVEFNTMGSTSGTLSRKFSDESLSALNALVGETVTGDWTLHVCDKWARDVGTLNRWSLNLS